ncbi:hypothetical protein Gbem_3869 [Citrifermentans bemidjiense Bem]|uniref:Uncharacterized protein n=1 Tax=Citrifermentans bemidjiense (strain ATCC BAA-1014 / DSM 16622 / JCM 12645 / Bem) TaxID=404380 RepID=B5EFA6_CITBB|nr:hypothetical protein [Citrifermentans bemidjiense]ACH40861.1 hypothetical protein Gbem_3869 [Citrifermentans bemidjiense Bem]
MRLSRNSDEPLNYAVDQQSNLTPQLRRMNLKLGLETALGVVSDPPATLLLGGAVALLLKRRFALASLCAAGFLLRQTITKRPTVPRWRLLTARERREIEFERSVLKAQRGDYGNLEVIAFK